MLERKSIMIKNLIIFAKHGCNQSEKVNEQPFSFDIKIFFDYEKSCHNDNIDSTISYSKIANLVDKFCKENSFNLLEKLASETCRMIMDNFSNIKKIKIKLKKIKPSTTLTVDSFGVSFTLQREIVYLALGSSLGDKEKNLNQAIECLKAERGIDVLKISSFIESEPHWGISKNIFLNGAVRVSTYLEPEELLDKIGEIEKRLGRRRDAGLGEDRIIDIDIIFFGEKEFFTDRLVIPHHDWANRDFVKNPLKELDPYLFDF